MSINSGAGNGELGVGITATAGSYDMRATLITGTFIGRKLQVSGFTSPLE